MSLGTNISRLRAEKRLSQGDLAEVLEVSRQSVSKWETDSSVPDLDKLIKLSQLFRVTLDELVTGAEPQLKVETPPVMVSPSMPGRKIAGIILFCMAFLAFLIPTVLGGILVGLILAVPFLVCGIICFLVRKRPGLWCAWAAYLAVYILYDNCPDFSGFNVRKHGLKTGSLKVRTRITVVRVPAQIGKAVLLCIGFKDTLLIGNGIAFALQLVLMG